MNHEIAVVAIIILDRLLVRCDTADQEFNLTPTNVRLALSGCLALAAKFYDDRFEKNTIFSVIFGIGKRQMRQIMDLILFEIEYDLVLREQDFRAYD